MSSKSKAEAPQSVTIKLIEPVKYGSEMVEELVVKPPRARHLREFPAKNQKVGDLMNVAALMCGRSDALIDELGMADWRQLEEVVSDFLDSSLGNGDGSSGP